MADHIGPVRSIREPRLSPVTLMVTRTTQGAGVVGDAIRQIVYLHTMDGKPIGVYDPDGQQELFESAWDLGDHE